MSETYIPSPEERKTDLELVDMLFMCISRWHWFAVSIFVCMAIGILTVLQTTPVFTRSATLLIKSSDSRSGRSVEQQISELGGFSANQVQDEMIALKSPAVTEEVVKRLHLDVNYSIPGTFHDTPIYGETLPIEVKFLSLTDIESASLTIELQKDGSFLLSDFSGPNTTSFEVAKVLKGQPHTVLNTPVGKILVNHTQHYFVPNRPIKVYRSTMRRAISYYNNISITLMEKQSNMLDLTFNDVNIQRAEDVINTTINVYNQYWLDDKNQVAINTSKFINERLRVIESELGNVDHSISSYKSSNMLPDAEAAGSAYFKKVESTGDRILDLNNELYMAKYVRQLVSKNKQKFELLPANSGINNAPIEHLISEYNENILTRNRQVANSSANHPLIEPLDERIINQRSVIQQSIDNLILTLETQIKNLRHQEDELNSKIARSPEQASHLTSIGREQKVKESLYIYLLQKREENELSIAYNAYNTRLITPPIGSNAPTAPVKHKILLIAFAIGFALPLARIYLGETMHTTVRGRKDLDKSAIPYIGEIPYNGKSKGWLARLFTTKSKKKKLRERSIVVKPQSNDEINEAFRVLRSNFEFVANTHGEGVVCMITSANVSSGKTFVSSNLAESLCIKKKKVCLIDLDLRKSTASKFVKSPKKGITDYIVGKCTIDEIIYPVNEQENFDIIPVGTRPPNPTEILYEEKLGELIKEMKTKYDYIFLDCPPIELVADASIIRNHADMTIFIVRAYMFELAMLSDIENYYNTARYPNMVLMLNGTIDTYSAYGYRYGYHYGYRYGYHYGYNNTKGHKE